MASSSQAQGSTQPRPPPQARVTLSYEEISKLFSLPIAEAASILGVCTSVLKRICRTHGIVRWPYRKLVSGKAGDDIKNAEREKAKELFELSKMAKQKALSSADPSMTSSPILPQGAAKPQQGMSKPGQVLPQGSKVVPGGSPNLAQTTQIRGIPTYMDDFKYGFPSHGLSSASVKWWGTTSHADSASVKDESQEPFESTDETSKVMTDEELDWGADDSAITSEPSAVLCYLRRKAVDDGRELLNGDGCKGQDLDRLNKRQKLVLMQVFGASFPDQWKNILS